MTYYHDDVDGPKHMRHWIHVAYRLALDICLNQEHLEGTLQPSQRRLWKRVWWCLFVRDRQVAIGTRQFPLVSTDQSAWSQLETTDFEIELPSQQVLAVFNTCRFLGDLSIQQTLVRTCIKQARLWEQLFGIMKVRYHPLSPRYGSTSVSTLILVPHPAQLNDTTFIQCEDALQSWLSDCQDHILSWPASNEFDSYSTPTTIHLCMTNLLYHGLQCVLHRPAGWTLQLRAKSHASVILAIFDYLQSRYLLHLLPVWSVTLLMQAALTFKDYSRDQPSQIRRRLQDCVEIFDGLKDTHMHAGFAMSVLTAFMSSRATKNDTRHRKADPEAAEELMRADDFPTAQTPFEPTQETVKELDDFLLQPPDVSADWFGEFFDHDLRM
jgi:hypothetical protein